MLVNEETSPIKINAQSAVDAETSQHEAASVSIYHSSSTPHNLPLMSANNQPPNVPNPSAENGNFTAIFDAASIEYLGVTGTRLDTHPFAAQLEKSHSPEAVSNLIRTQAQAFTKFRNTDQRLMTWLNPTVHILSTFSATLGEGIGLVSRLIHFISLFLRRLVLSHSRLRRPFSLPLVSFLRLVSAEVRFHAFF